MNKNIKLIVNIILLIDFIFVMWVFDIEYSPSKAQIILLLLSVSLLITDFKDSTATPVDDTFETDSYFFLQIRGYDCINPI